MLSIMPSLISNSRRVHCLQHGLYEYPGIIVTWALQRHYSITITHAYLEHALPQVDDFDLLILLGGPCSLRDPYVLAAFAQEIELIQKTISMNKPTLGICLGAQLIAESLGAPTEPSPHVEIGVFPVEQLPDAAKDPVFSTYPTSFPALHLHYDMFGLPTGAHLLASSLGCPRQAFRFGWSVYGLQYHLEKTQEVFDLITPMLVDLLYSAHFVVNKQQLMNYPSVQMNADLLILLDYLVTKII